jgi:hypothetical protein
MSDFANDPGYSDRRFQGFITWFGEVPREASRLRGTEARECAARWVPHRFGHGFKSHGYVIACQLDARWWTVSFEQVPEGAPTDTENWCIEAYTHDCGGCAWAANYFYWPSEDRWRHFFRGENYGRRLQGDGGDR